MMKNRRLEIEHNFTYHAPNSEQIEKYQQIREKYKELALFLLEITPVSREQSLALTQLEYSCMMANAAIARNA